MLTPTASWLLILGIFLISLGLAAIATYLVHTSGLTPLPEDQESAIIDSEESQA